MMQMNIGRRGALLGAAAAVSSFAIGGRAFAQTQPVVFGALPPLTGAGGPYGPAMLRAMQGVVEQANSAGGIKGRQVRLAFEDDQTNPDAGVRGARKLIDVDRVQALMGTWASSVTTAVAPLCWENRVPLFTVSGADSITLLPHQGHIFRTQPNSRLQIETASKWLLGKGARRVFHMAAQSPFAQSSQEVMTATLGAAGGTVSGYIVYEREKTAFRSEVDQIMRSRSDTVMLNGYLPDVTILLRELYRAGFDGRRFTFAYAAPASVFGTLPNEVTNGLTTFQPSPDLNSPAFTRLKAAFGNTEVDPYSAQVHDHATMAILAAAQGGEATGTVIRENVRKISQGDGEKVDNVTDGLRLIAAGRAVNFEGASGPCEFDDRGDIRGTKFRYEVAEGGAYRVLELV
ncbi:ABC transporter substrate-binding protein [Falsiroseomonas sp.]|uniref:ABC transporter substrate-binding protein n=1 Tax=Falsiroseomonas sp. TaxID=2870721 RepID=UPI0027157088|nr:ABC transporter substrate-binding protein [Falsiroseomonas sp.]MDO9502703.1 ABC transporter substrate-binding protein [Falsiroseomonas sp.]MDP3416463.1 ABC transporter substrate-binding protein [Falsiroseomonas sp.]